MAATQFKAVLMATPQMRSESGLTIPVEAVRPHGLSHGLHSFAAPRLRRANSPAISFASGVVGRESQNQLQSQNPHFCRKGAAEMGHPFPAGSGELVRRFVCVRCRRNNKTICPVFTRYLGRTIFSNKRTTTSRCDPFVISILERSTNASVFTPSVCGCGYGCSLFGTYSQCLISNHDHFSNQ